MGFFFTLLYVCILFIRPQEFITELKGLPLLDFLAVGCIVFIFLEGGFSAAKFKRSHTSYLIIALWAIISLSNVVTGWFGGMIFAFQDFAKVVIVYLLIIFSVDTLPRLKLFVWVMVFMSAFLSIQSILMYYTGAGLVGGEALQRGEILQMRGIGIFADPNDLAINIVPMLTFVLPAFHKNLLSRTWITGLFFLIPMITGLAFTRSRGGILGLGAVGWYYFYRRVGIWGSLIPVAIIFSFLLALPRMGEISTKESAARARLDHWSYGLQCFKRSPVFGIGYSRFTDDYHHTAHNSFILVLAEEGFIGAFIWVCIFFCLFREIRFLHRLPRPPPFLTPMLDALSGSLSGWLVCAFFLSQTYKPLSYILMGILVATMNVLARQGYEVQHPWTARQYMLGALLTVGAIVFMYVALIVLWAI